MAIYAPLVGCDEVQSITVLGCLHGKRFRGGEGFCMPAELAQFTDPPKLQFNWRECRACHDWEIIFCKFRRSLIASTGFCKIHPFVTLLYFQIHQMETFVG